MAKKIEHVKYAIREKFTSNYIPELEKTHRGGGSWTELTPMGECVPRLFDTERAAKSCIAQWKRGHHSKDRGTDTDHWSGAQEYYEENKITEVPGRKDKQLEVVEVTLTFPAHELPLLERMEHG